MSAPETLDIAADENDAIGSVLYMQGQIWRLEKVIGRGSTSIVYHARAQDGSSHMGRMERYGDAPPVRARAQDSSKHTGRKGYAGDVAVKMLHRAESCSSVTRERFERETVLLCALSNPRVLKGLARGRHFGCPFIVCEHLTGPTLGELLARQGPCGLEWALRTLCDALEALVYLFDDGRVRAHRDIKPGNLMFASDGHLKLIDLGVAKTDLHLTYDIDTHFLGSLHYMAPEQIDDAAQADIRADIYALGAVFFEMCTGWQAFPGQQRRDILAAHLTGKIPVLPDKLLAGDDEYLGRLCTEILQMTLAADPLNRFQTPSEFLEFINRGLAARNTAILRRDRDRPLCR